MIDKALDYEGLKLYNSKVKSEYIKDLTLQDNTITYTKGDGGTGVIELNSGEGNGNADTLDGHDSTYFASKESVDSIQTTSSGTLSQVGWYRVAEYNANATAVEGAASNSCELFIKRLYTNTNCENHHLLLMSRYQRGQKIVSLYDSSSDHLITKARYTIEGTAAYLEIYYNSDSDNFCYFEVTHGKDIDYCWQAITPILTSETVDGVTITCTYDIPANASPVTTVDDTNQTGWVELTEGFDLNNALGKYRTPHMQIIASLINCPVDSGEIAVEFIPFNDNKDYGMQMLKQTMGGVTPYIYIRSKSSISWSEWKQIATTADLTNYLQLSGGTIKGTFSVGDNSGAITRIFNLENVNRRISLEINPEGKYEMYDYTNSNAIITSLKNGETTFNGVASGNLKLEGGGTVNGTISVKLADNGYTQIMKNHSSTDDFGTQLRDVDKDGNVSHIGISALSQTLWFNNRGVTYDILHSGNFSEYALPLDGSKAMTGNLSITNTNGSIAVMTSTSGIGLLDKNTTKWILRKFGGAYYVDDDKAIIHSGNYTGYITPANIGALSTTDTATKATADANGNNIVNTYATKSSLGTQVTYSLEGTTLYINTK